MQGLKQLYRIIIHPFLLKHETEIDEYMTHFGEKGVDVLKKVSQSGVNLAASAIVTSAMKVRIS